MSSGDKILNRISLDCDERISKIGAETDEKCTQIMAQAKLDADKISAEIADKGTVKGQADAGGFKEPLRP